jgi:hypothetical protein
MSKPEILTRFELMSGGHAPTGEIVDTVDRDYLTGLLHPGFDVSDDRFVQGEDVAVGARVQVCE